MKRSGAEVCRRYYETPRDPDESDRLERIDFSVILVGPYVDFRDASGESTHVAIDRIDYEFAVVIDEAIKLASPYWSHPLAELQRHIELRRNHELAVAVDISPLCILRDPSEALSERPAMDVRPQSNWRGMLNLPSSQYIPTAQLSLPRPTPLKMRGLHQSGSALSLPLPC